MMMIGTKRLLLWRLREPDKEVGPVKQIKCGRLSQLSWLLGTL